MYWNIYRIKKAKILLLRTAITATVALSMTSISHGKNEIRDIGKITLWEIEDTIPSDLSPDTTLDFSSSSYLGTEERLYRSYGDTLISRISGGVREWLEVREDTINIIGADSRTDAYRYAGRVPYLILDFYENNIASKDSMRNRYCLVFDNLNYVNSQYISCRGNGIVFPDMSTVENTWHICTITSDTIYRHEYHRWYCPNSLFPILENELLFSSAGELLGTRTLVCPPAEHPAQQLRNKMARHSEKEYNFSNQNSRDNSKESEPTSYKIEQNGRILTLDIANPMSRAKIQCTIYDTQGRLWHKASGPFILDTSDLPEGPYLINVSQGTNNETVKIWVR